MVPYKGVFAWDSICVLTLSLDLGYLGLFGVSDHRYYGFMGYLWSYKHGFGPFWAYFGCLRNEFRPC